MTERYRQLSDELFEALNAKRANVLVDNSVFTGNVEDSPNRKKTIAPGYTHGSRLFRDKRGVCGSLYRGDWVDGKLHGKATCWYTDGRRFDGEWCEGKRYGPGVFTYVCGVQWIGEWVEGSAEGSEGRYVLADGTEIGGEFIEKGIPPHVLSAAMEQASDFPREIVVAEASFTGKRPSTDTEEPKYVLRDVVENDKLLITLDVGSKRKTITAPISFFLNLTEITELSVGEQQDTDVYNVTVSGLGTDATKVSKDVFMTFSCFDKLVKIS